MRLKATVTAVRFKRFVLDPPVQQFCYSLLN